MKQKLLGMLLLAAGSLFAIACSQEWEHPDSAADEVTVTFSVSAESGMVSTRSTNTPLESSRKISKGLLIDKVVYAVYVKKYDDEKLDENGKPKPTWTGEFELLSQYGDGTPGLGDGQALLPLTKDENGNSNLLSKGETLTLRLMRGQEYVIAFWAQNSACKAYNTEKLENVVVDYGGLAPNNDESRDAFYQDYTFVAQANNVKPHEVVLKRAMAQINVGTAGWDYNGEVEYGFDYAYSKIVMKGLYDQLNVLTGEVSKTEAVGEGENEKEITYDWAKLPAYIYNDIPDDLTAIQNNEEFLWVKLTTEMPNSAGDENFWGNYLKYLTEEPAEMDKITTEVFKYLSMCYVLAPTYEPDDKTTPARGGTTIGNLTFYLAETADGKIHPEPDSDELAAAPVRFSISSVPIQRNWRTNILGGTRDKSTTLFDPRNVRMLVDLSPGFRDDHNYQDKMNGELTDEDCKNEDEKGSAPAQGAE